MRYSLSIILVSLCFFGCFDNLNDKSKRNEDWVWWVDAKTGHTKWIPYEGDGMQVKDGQYTRFYFNGNIYKKGKKVDGSDVDTMFEFDKNGRIQYYGTPNDDSSVYFLHNGPITLYFPDGGVRAAGIVKNHHVGGYWRDYERNGQVASFKNLKNDTGWCTYYYQNGNVEDSVYFEGKKTYNLKHWYENGQKERDEPVKDGVIKHYYSNGQLKNIGYYVNGRRNGTEKFWYEDGKIQAISERKDGLLNGKSLYYFENGKIQYAFYYVNDKLDGEAKEFDENGTIKYDKEFKSGVFVENKLKKPSFSSLSSSLNP